MEISTKVFYLHLALRNSRLKGISTQMVRKKTKSYLGRRTVDGVGDLNKVKGIICVANNVGVSRLERRATAEIIAAGTRARRAPRPTNEPRPRSPSPGPRSLRFPHFSATKKSPETYYI